MSNKTELHLKTIHFQQGLAAQSRVATQPSLPLKRPSSGTQSRLRQSISQKQQIKSSSKRASIKINPHDDFLSRFQELEINRRSLKVFTTTAKSQIFRQSGEFPRREPQLRNTNAFKYFVNSTINRVPAPEEKYLDEFYRKIATAISQQATRANLIVQRHPRAITECSTHQARPIRPRRPMSTSSKQIRASSKAPRMNPQPWQTTPEQPFLTAQF